MRKPPRSAFPVVWLARIITLIVTLIAGALPTAHAQGTLGPPGEDADNPQPENSRAAAHSEHDGSRAREMWRGTLQTLHAPDGAPSSALSSAVEIFPDASKVWMSVRDTDALPIEAARRGGKWLCSSGQCRVKTETLGQSAVGDDMLRSIKLQAPTLPLPLTIWGRIGPDGKRVLDFDPVLLGRRSYAHVCAYPPPEPGKSRPDKVPVCRDAPAAVPLPDSVELTLGFQWPGEVGDFRYLAIVDSCGNARVQPFQRTFTVPVFEVASGGCGKPDGKVLRIFPQGGWLRVTAFNLEGTAVDNVVNATYRVSVPALENLVETNPAKLLFPDPRLDDLKIDCGPALRKAPTDAQGIPRPPPGAAPHASGPPPPRSTGAAAVAPAGASMSASAAVGAHGVGGSASAAGRARGKHDGDAATPSPQPLAHQAVAIAPEPLRLGNCRIRLTGQTKRRLVAPLSLWVSLIRTDRGGLSAPLEFLREQKWIVTPNSAEFLLPPLTEGFDGESRLRLAVSSNPLSADGKVVLLSDAARVASSLRTNDSGSEEGARRLIGSLTIHSVPLCGESNFETLDAAGNCLRAYLTIPFMLATLQVTRLPWQERALVTTSIFSAAGVALAFDSYDPVERRAFPVAAQVGGFIQRLGADQTGLLGYVGVAPTIPILGNGGNTTTVGLLGGVGMEYIINAKGPDEGLKPAAFLSFVVQVGQATPSFDSKGSLGASLGQ